MSFPNRENDDQNLGISKVGENLPVLRSQQLPGTRQVTGEIQRSIARVDGMRQELEGSIIPQTFGRKIRQEIAKRLPVTQLRTKIAGEPMDVLQARIRERLITLRDDVETLIESGRDGYEYHQTLAELVNQVKTNPDDAQIWATLENQLTAPAQADSAIKMRDETQAFVEDLEARQTDEQKADSREQILRQAEGVIQYTGPLISTLEALILQGSRTYRQLGITYSQVLALREPLNAIHRTSDHLMRANELQVTSFNAMVGELNLGLASAQMAAQLGEAIKHLQTDVMPQELEQIGGKAEALLKAQGIEIKEVKGQQDQSKSASQGRNLPPGK